MKRQKSSARLGPDMVPESEPTNFTLRALILLLVLVAPPIGRAQPDFQTTPRLVGNPSGRVPLAAVIEFSAAFEFDAGLKISDGENTWETGITTNVRGKENYSIPVLGMRPGRNHEITLSIETDGQETYLQTFQHVTPALPENQSEFPQIDVMVSQPERMEPGITFLTLRRRALGIGRTRTERQRAFTTGWGKVIAIDHRGDVVWWFETDSRVAGIERLMNGNILIQRVTSSTLEIDLLGNIIAEYYAEKTPNHPTGPNAIKIQGIDVLHHQPHQMSTGDFLAFSAYATVFEDWYSSDVDPLAPRTDVPVMVDELIQYDRDGNVKWTWDALDYLDPDRIGYDTFWSFWWGRGFPGHMDWSHGNGISYHEPDDSILASFRNLSATVMIDRESKDIKWLLGRHEGWPAHMQDKLLTPVGELMWPGYSHNPRITEAGTVIMFDNRAHGGPFLAFEETLPLLQRFSRAVEFEVDPVAMTVRQVWTSGDTQESDSCYTDAMGDAWRLPITGNRLVIHAFCVPLDPRLYERQGDTWSFYPFGGRVLEYEGLQEVFRAEIYDRDDLFQWEIYGGFRTHGFHQLKSSAN